MITVRLKEKLLKGGVTSDKIVSAVIDKYTKDFREPIYESKQDELLGTIEYMYEKPPLLEVNAINLKISLVYIAEEFGIKGDLEIDHGNSFTY